MARSRSRKKPRKKSPGRDEPQKTTCKKTKCLKYAPKSQYSTEDSDTSSCSEYSDAPDSSFSRPPPTHEPPENNPWTLSEDHQLRGMKEDDRKPSWGTISKTLRRSKEQVKRRWEKIKHKETQNHDTSSSESSSDSSSESETDYPEMEPALDMEERRQMRYLHRHIYAELYPAPGGAPEWRGHDQELLDILERRYECHKWLQIQASLYNATGQMVPPDVLRERRRRQE